MAVSPTTVAKRCKNRQIAKPIGVKSEVCTSQSDKEAGLGRVWKDPRDCCGVRRAE